MFSGNELANAFATTVIICGAVCGVAGALVAIVGLWLMGAF